MPFDELIPRQSNPSSCQNTHYLNQSGSHSTESVKTKYIICSTWFTWKLGWSCTVTEVVWYFGWNCQAIVRAGVFFLEQLTGTEPRKYSLTQKLATLLRCDPLHFAGDTLTSACLSEWCRAIYCLFGQYWYYKRILQEFVVECYFFNCVAESQNRNPFTDVANDSRLTMRRYRSTQLKQLVLSLLWDTAYEGC
jgi:hypothetical protein